jgi:hypothetical protein
MTDIDIIRMAKEAGGDDWGIFRDFMPEIEHFAALVAAAEREACAALCDRGDPMFKPALTQFDCADLIRARGQE